jgi:aspartokinase/homoserine dehydrogenase 1
MNVLKFGGTSVANAQCIAQVKSIVQANAAAKWIVVSAMSGVTDMLLAAYKHAVQGNDYMPPIEEIMQKHLHAAQTLLSPPCKEEVFAGIQHLIKKLNACLHKAAMERIFSGKEQDYAVSFGERLNGYLISMAIENAVWVDARPLIKTNSHFGNAKVDLALTYQKCYAALHGKNKTAIIGGFIASDQNGNTTTLGRGGSDYTAAIIAAAMHANCVEIWTDANGFMTADPRRIHDAKTIQQMTYAEVFELAKYGAKVIYPPTVYPLLMSKIPMLIKNTFNPNNAGTLVTDDAMPHQQPICSVSAVEHAALFCLKEKTASCMDNIYKELDSMLGEAHITMLHCQQTAQELWFIVNAADKTICQDILEKSFSCSASIETTEDISLIAAVGENLRGSHDILPKIMDALRHNNIAVKAAAQQGISILSAVCHADMPSAIACIHQLALG